MRVFLKIFAWLSKIVAALILSYTAYIIISLDVSSLHAPNHWVDGENWGTPAFKHRIYLEIIGMLVIFLLAMLPNRWLVSSRIIFVVSLLIALIPIGMLLFDAVSDTASEGMDLSDLFSLIGIVISIPLPLSLILSFMRLQKGEKVFYA